MRSEGPTPNLYIPDPALWRRVDAEAARRKLFRKDKPNRSACAAQLLAEALDACGEPVPSLASQAEAGGQEAGACEGRILAALVLSEGVISKAAELLGASDRDARRAIKILGMGPEIRRRWKGAAS